MSNRPIIFSKPMVRALLREAAAPGTGKTQTRRMSKVDVPDAPAMDNVVHAARHPAPYLDAYCGERKTPANPRGMSRHWSWWTRDDRPCRQFSVGFAPGDRLWVREAITRFDKGTCDQHVWYRAGGNFLFTSGEHAYQAAFPSLTGDEEWPFEEGPGGGAPYNSPSIHMPRWASRLTLLVTDVRVERLQDISEADATAEGVDPIEAHSTDFTRSARYEFALLWQTLHGTDAWAENPWVAALSFEVRAGNIDRLQAAEEREPADA